MLSLHGQSQKRRLFPVQAHGVLRRVRVAIATRRPLSRVPTRNRKRGARVCLNRLRFFNFFWHVFALRNRKRGPCDSIVGMFLVCNVENFSRRHVRIA